MIGTPSSINTKMPALDPIPHLSAEDRRQFDRARSKSEAIANALPLVRVVVPLTHSGARVSERDDVLIDGKLRVGHKSPRTRELERRLGAPDGLYFHAGRTHPDYGLMVLVFDEVPPPCSATPFGLGGLLCDMSHAAADMPSCVMPVSHRAEPDQKSFYNGSRFTGPWRSSAADYFSLYFDDVVSQYFANGAHGRPRRVDPDMIYGSPGAQDWRAWTIEVVCEGDVDVIAIAQTPALKYWGLESALEARLQDEALDLEMTISELYPLFGVLPPEKRIRASDTVSVLAVVDRKIQADMPT